MNTEEYHLNILLTLLEDYFPEHTVWVNGKTSINNLTLTSTLELSVLGARKVKPDVMKLAINAFKASDLPFDVVFNANATLDCDMKKEMDYRLLKG